MVGLGPLGVVWDPTSDVDGRIGGGTTTSFAIGGGLTTTGILTGAGDGTNLTSGGGDLTTGGMPSLFQ